jgi:hypothetical protein
MGGKEMNFSSAIAFETSSESSPPGGPLGYYPTWQREQNSSSSISSSEVLPANRASASARMTPHWMAGVFRRIVDLSKRNDDWDSYGAPRLQVEVLRAFVQTLEGYSYAIQNEPLISLTSNGGLLCSWESSQASMDLSFEVAEVTRVYYEDAATGQEFDLSLHECETVEKWLWRASSSS